MHHNVKQFPLFKQPLSRLLVNICWATGPGPGGGGGAGGVWSAWSWWGSWSSAGAGTPRAVGTRGRGHWTVAGARPGPGPREQRASIICTCVEQQGCNLKTCNTDCLHFCNPGQLCAEFPYWKEKLHEWGMQRRRRLLPFAAQATHRIWERAREPTWTLAAPSEGPLTALLGRGVALGSPGRRRVPREGPRQGAAPTKLRREPGHRDHQLRVSGDMLGPRATKLGFNCNKCNC